MCCNCGKYWKMYRNDKMSFGIEILADTQLFYHFFFLSFLSFLCTGGHNNLINWHHDCWHRWNPYTIFMHVLVVGHTYYFRYLQMNRNRPVSAKSIELINGTNTYSPFQIWFLNCELNHVQLINVTEYQVKPFEFFFCLLKFMRSACVLCVCPPFIG